MAKPERSQGHGVTREGAQRIVELAKTHGLDHVHPLLTCPKVTSIDAYGIKEAAKRHKIKIGSEDPEVVRQALRAVMDGLLPNGYPHRLSNPDRKLLVGYMREHGVGPVQQTLGLRLHLTIHKGVFEANVKRFKADPEWPAKLR